MEAVFSVHLSSTVLSLLFVKNCSTTTKTSAKTKAKIEFNFDDFQQRQLFNLKISQESSSRFHLFFVYLRMKKNVKRIKFIFNTKSWDPRNNYQIDILFFIWSKKVNLEFLYFIEIFILFKIKNALQWYFVNKIVLTYCEKKKCSGDSENLLKFKAEGREFEIFFRSLEQFIQTVKGQNNFW